MKKIEAYKAPYTKTLLKDALIKERENLKEYQSNSNSSDPLISRQAKGNISNCEFRVNEITESIKLLFQEPLSVRLKKEMLEYAEKK